MRGMWTMLPPFAPDTDGFSSVINGTDGIGIIDDAQGCGTNYYGNVETRNAMLRRSFASELTHIDAIMGTQNKLYERFEQCAGYISPAFVLFAGSPISSVIGTDLCLAAEEFSDTYGIPAGYVDTDGHEFYSKGIEETLLALFRLIDFPARNPMPKSVNLLGACPIDVGDESVTHIQEILESNGFHVLTVWGGNDWTLEGARESVHAERNIVLTASGLKLAKVMKEKFNIPYVVCFPAGHAEMRRLLGTKEEPLPMNTVKHSEKVLVIGEQVISEAVRHSLEGSFSFQDVRVCGFFKMDSGLMRDGDKRFYCEEDLIQFLGKFAPDICLCDPCISPLLPQRAKWIPIVHRAISGRRYIRDEVNLIGESLDAYLKKWLLD